MRRYAGLVWRFVKLAGEVAGATEGRGEFGGGDKVEEGKNPENGEEGLAGEDVKLLRLRSGKKELVVVPGEYFLRRDEMRLG